MLVNLVCQSLEAVIHYTWQNQILYMQDSIPLDWATLCQKHRDCLTLEKPKASRGCPKSYMPKPYMLFNIKYVKGTNAA